jgi:hypothetical protein
MALEPREIAGKEESPERRAMSRRFWLSAILNIPVVVLAMGHMLPGNFFERPGFSRTFGVAGVYLISDTLSEKLYVGSASGEGRIWQCWSCYAADGPRGDIELHRFLTEAGVERAKKFR